jgi:hypothetical protein
MKTINGMLRILLGIATLGLVPAFLPRFIHWEPPPKSEQMRGSRQRRVRPEGDRSEETEEVILSPPRWYKRLYLFWTCPVVLFHTDKIICVCINLMFTFWFLAHRQAVNADAVAAGVGGLGDHSITLLPFKVSSNLNIEPLQGVEMALCIYYGCSLVRELTEILCELDDWRGLCDVLKKYISSFWNVLDMGEIVAFLAGILYRVIPGEEHSRQHGQFLHDTQHYHPEGGSGGDEVYTGEEWTNWSLAYGACLFIAWFRVLRSCDALPTTLEMCGSYYSLKARNSTGADTETNTCLDQVLHAVEAWDACGDIPYHAHRRFHLHCHLLCLFGGMHDAVRRHRVARDPQAAHVRGQRPRAN